MIDKAEIDKDCDEAIGHLIAMAERAFETYGPPEYHQYEHQIRQAFAIGWVTGHKKARTKEAAE